jgi:hypothetical protein
LQQWNDPSGRRRLAAAAIAACLSWGTPAHAVEYGGGMAQLHGFATQTFITTSDNNFFGETSEDDHFGFTELGLNGSFRPSPSLQAAAQLLSRRAGEGDDGDVRFDYALVDYSPLSDARNRMGLRVGRIMNPLGLYNDTRDVAFTRPSIFLPQSIYFDRTRDLALSADGVHAYGEHRFDRSELFWQLGVVRPRVKHPEIERGLLRADRPGSLEPDTSYVGRLLWELDGGKLRLAVSGAVANMSYEPDGDPLGDGSIKFTPVIYSFQYNRESWNFTAEYARRSFDLRDFNIANTTVMGESAYVQGIWRLNDDWNVLLRYDALYSDKDDRYGKTAPAGVPAYSRYAQDATVGLGWNATPSVLVRAEYHKVKGTAWLPSLDNPDPSDTREHWDMFAILASYRF